MSIDHFPPELLKIIFSNEKIPLKQRIALRGVCSHWLEVIDEHVLKKTTELVLSSDKSDGTESNHLPYKDELVPLFIHLFPKLTNLFVHFNRESFKAPYTALPRLLTPLSTTLTTLKLNLSNIGHHFKYHDPLWITHFTTALNSLSTLTALHLNNADDITHTFPQLLPTFSRLRQFYCSSFPYSIDLIPSQFWQVITANQPLSNLTTLEIAQTSAEYDRTVIDLVATFPSLQSLKLDLHPQGWFEDNYLADIFPHLASLQHLTELNLVGLDEFESHLLPSPTDQRLTQVKKLTLTDSYLGLVDLTTVLVAWFPLLEVLCFHYEIDDLSDFPYLTNTTLRSLARLEQLIELNLNNENNEKNVFILIYTNLIPPQPTERPIIGLKRLHLLLEGYVELDHNTSPLVAWFPSLQYLNLGVLYDYYPKDLTTAILRDIGQLKSLVELELPEMRYEKEELEPPLPDDRPLACLKVLELEIVYPPKDFDGSYFCSTVTAWFPALKMLNITIYYGGCDEDGDENYKMFRRAKKARKVIRKAFDSSVKLNIYIEEM